MIDNLFRATIGYIKSLCDLNLIDFILAESEFDHPDKKSINQNISN